MKKIFAFLVSCLLLAGCKPYTPVKGRLFIPDAKIRAEVTGLCEQYASMPSLQSLMFEYDEALNELKDIFNKDWQNAKVPSLIAKLESLETQIKKLLKEENSIEKYPATYRWELNKAKLFQEKPASKLSIGKFQFSINNNSSMSFSDFKVWEFKTLILFEWPRKVSLVEACFLNRTTVVRLETAAKVLQNFDDLSEPTVTPKFKNETFRLVLFIEEN